jgi:hypothetical protein
MSALATAADVGSSSGGIGTADLVHPRNNKTTHKSDTLVTLFLIAHLLMCPCYIHDDVVYYL